MDVATELITYLKTQTDVTDLIGTTTAARIWQNTAKQGAALPHIVFDVFASGSAEDLTGPAGMATNRVDLAVYAATNAAAYALAEIIRLLLQGYSGTMGSGYVNDISSSGGYDQGFDKPIKGGNTNRYFCARDYIINHTEAT